MAFTPDDLADHAAFVAEYTRRNAAIYAAPKAWRAKMARDLRRDMDEDTLLAPVTVLSPTQVAA